MTLFVGDFTLFWYEAIYIINNIGNKFDTKRKRR